MADAENTVTFLFLWGSCGGAVLVFGLMLGVFRRLVRTQKLRHIPREYIPVRRKEMSQTLFDGLTRSVEENAGCLPTPDTHAMQSHGLFGWGTCASKEHVPRHMQVPLPSRIRRRVEAGDAPRPSNTITLPVEDGAIGPGAFSFRVFVQSTLEDLEVLVTTQMPEFFRSPFYTPRQYIDFLQVVSDLDLTPEPYISLLEAALYSEHIPTRTEAEVAAESFVKLALQVSPTCLRLFQPEEGAGAEGTPSHGKMLAGNSRWRGRSALQIKLEHLFGEPLVSTWVKRALEGRVNRSQTPPPTSTASADTAPRISSSTEVHERLRPHRARAALLVEEP